MECRDSRSSNSIQRKQAVGLLGRILDKNQLLQTYVKALNEQRHKTGPSDEIHYSGRLS